MPKITELYAFISEDSPGDEGLISFLGSGGIWYPMVGADTARVLDLKKEAQKIADVTGKTVKLLWFTDVKLVDVIEPTR